MFTSNVFRKFSSFHKNLCEILAATEPVQQGKIYITPSQRLCPTSNFIFPLAQWLEISSHPLKLYFEQFRGIFFLIQNESADHCLVYLQRARRWLWDTWWILRFQDLWCHLSAISADLQGEVCFFTSWSVDQILSCKMYHKIDSGLKEFILTLSTEN